MLRSCLLFVALTACATEDHDVDPSSTTEAYIVAPAAGAPPAEIVQISRTDIFTNYTYAFRIRDNLAVGPYLPRIVWSNANETIEYLLSSTFKSVAADNNAPRRPYVSTAQTLPGLAVYNLDEAASSANRIDARTTTALTGQQLECWGLKMVSSNRWERRAVTITVTGGTTDELATVPAVATAFLEPGDVGVPCITTTSPRLLSGVVKHVDAATHAATLYRAGGLAYWFDGLANLASLRLDSRFLGPYTIATTPPTATTKMCIDIPWADPRGGTDVQQYPCHADQYFDDGINQMFYIDNTVPAGTHPRLVSALSGRCLDVEWADLVAGRHLQEYDCHAGANQKFNAGSTTAALLMPDSGLPASGHMCISVHGGPSTSAAAIEQQTCVSSPDQMWTFQAAPHLPPI